MRDTRHHDLPNASPPATPVVIHSVDLRFQRLVQNNHNSIAFQPPVAIEPDYITTTLVSEIDTIADINKRDEGTL